MANLGYILYEGPSLLDHRPIVAIATLSSGNKKTGNMVQTWILRQDISPIEAVKTRQDASICGDCPHRPAAYGGCYVNVAHAPNEVWKAYKAGRYHTFNQTTNFRGRPFRIGSYGDPAAVPQHVWRAALQTAGTHTGYTHQWRRFDIQDLAMASVDTPSERRLAKSHGWRTFRTTTAEETRGRDESLCPASSAAPTHDLIQCETCLACCGTARQLRGDIAIPVHGAAHLQTKYNRLRAIYNPPETAHAA